MDIIKYGEYIRELVLKSNDGQGQMWNKPQLMNVLKTMPRLNHLDMKQSSHVIHYCKHLIKIETKNSRKVAEPIQHLVKVDVSLRPELTNNISMDTKGSISTCVMFSRIDCKIFI